MTLLPLLLCLSRNVEGPLVVDIEFEDTSELSFLRDTGDDGEANDVRYGRLLVLTAA